MSCHNDDVLDIKSSYLYNLYELTYSPYTMLSILSLFPFFLVQEAVERMQRTELDFDCSCYSLKESNVITKKVLKGKSFFGKVAACLFLSSSSFTFLRIRFHFIFNMLIISIHPAIIIMACHFTSTSLKSKAVFIASHHKKTAALFFWNSSSERVHQSPIFCGFLPPHCSMWSPSLYTFSLDSPLWWNEGIKTFLLNAGEEMKKNLLKANIQKRYCDDCIDSSEITTFLFYRRPRQAFPLRKLPLNFKKVLSLHSTGKSVA